MQKRAAGKTMGKLNKFQDSRPSIGWQITIAPRNGEAGRLRPTPLHPLRACDWTPLLPFPVRSPRLGCSAPSEMLSWWAYRSRAATGDTAFTRFRRGKTTTTTKKKPCYFLVTSPPAAGPRATLFPELSWLSSRSSSSSRTATSGSDDALAAF